MKRFLEPWTFAQGVSDHEPWTFVSTLVSTLSVSTFALVSTVNSFQQLFYTGFEPSSLFSAMISNSASTAARTTVSCLKSAPARVLLQGPPGIGIARNLTLAGDLFSKYCLKPLFSYANHFFDQK